MIFLEKPPLLFIYFNSGGSFSSYCTHDEYDKNMVYVALTYDMCE